MLLQIPEEEKNLGPHDRLIHVYHFTRDSNQNQVVRVCCLNWHLTTRFHNAFAWGVQFVSSPWWRFFQCSLNHYLVGWEKKRILIKHKNVMINNYIIK